MPPSDSLPKAWHETRGPSETAFQKHLEILNDDRMTCDEKGDALVTLLSEYRTALLAHAEENQKLTKEQLAERDAKYPISEADKEKLETLSKKINECEANAKCRQALVEFLFAATGVESMKERLRTARE